MHHNSNPQACIDINVISVVILSYFVIMLSSKPLSVLAVTVITFACLVRVSESSNINNLLTEERKAAFLEWTGVHGKDYETEAEITQRLITWAENDGTFSDNNDTNKFDLTKQSKCNLTIHILLISSERLFVYV